MTLRRVALVSLAVIVLVYGVSPWLAAHLLPPLLGRWGVESSEFSFGYPRWSGVDVASVQLSTADARVSGNDVRIAYRIAGLVKGEVEAVDVGELTVRIGRSTASSEASGAFDVASFWTLIPARQVVIRNLDVMSTDPEISAHGSVSFDPRVLQVRLGVESPLLAVPVDVDAAVNPNGRVAVTLLERGTAVPIASLAGVPDDDRRAMTFDGRMALTGQPLALAAAYAGATLTSGSAEVNVRGRTVWPLPTQNAWKAFDGAGTYRIELAGAAPQVSEGEARIKGDFTIANGEVKARVEAGSFVAANVPQLRRIAGKADLDERITISSEETVDIDFVGQNVRVGDGLVMALTASGKPLRVRARGALGADRRFELGVVGLDGAPMVLATGVPDGSDALTVKAQLALTGRALQTVAAAAGYTVTGGHVVTDFEGSVQLSPELAVQYVAGKGRVRVALTGRLPPEQRFDAAIEGDYTIGDAIKATFDSGARVVLAPDGFELSTVSPLSVEGRTSTPLQLRVQNVDLKVALPPTAVGEHTVTLNGAWMSLEQVTMDGDSIGATAVLRTHSGRNALPLRVTLSHDLATATGAFSAVGDWQVTRAVLETQLPGFDAAYDLDEGTIGLALDGSWSASKELDFSAKGTVRIDGRKAHYEDYAITGLRVDVPFAMVGDALTVPDANLTVDTFDVGFPLTDVSLSFAVANGFARVHGLSGSVLGGKFAAEPFEYALETDKSSLAVDISGVALADVLALEGGDVKGSGLLDGRLPVTLDGEAYSVTDGRIAARPPGGTLMYKGAAASSMAAQSGIGFAFQALEDFRYDTLDANVVLATDGALKLAVKLQGFNPAVEQGRAIQFNLNLNESLPALLQSLRAADNITNSLEERFGP